MASFQQQMTLDPPTDLWPVITRRWRLQKVTGEIRASMPVSPSIKLISPLHRAARDGLA